MLQWSWCTITSLISLLLDTVLPDKIKLATQNLFDGQGSFNLVFCFNHDNDCVNRIKLPQQFGYGETFQNIICFTCSSITHYTYYKNKQVNIDLVILSFVCNVDIFVCYIFKSMMNIHYSFNYDPRFVGTLLCTTQYVQVDVKCGDNNISIELGCKAKLYCVQLISFGIIATLDCQRYI